MKTLFVSALLLASLGLAQRAQAADTQELIVLLATNTETVALDVAPRERLRRSLPSTLAEGPLDVRFLIQARAQGSARDHLNTAPDSAAARLERYLVLRYPLVVDTAAVARSLRTHSNVLHVRPNQLVEVSAVIPNDPLFAQGPPADQHQWGSHLLRLPDAWQRTTGHGYVGILDLGVEPAIRIWP